MKLEASVERREERREERKEERGKGEVPCLHKPRGLIELKLETGQHLDGIFPSALYILFLLLSGSIQDVHARSGSSLRSAPPPSMPTYNISGTNTSFTATNAPFWYFSPACQMQYTHVKGFLEMLEESGLRYKYCLNPYRTWDDLFQNASAGAVNFRTGGLGLLTLPNLYEAWMCIAHHPCALDPNDSYFCWVFNEQKLSWQPWGENSNLNLFEVSQTACRAQSSSNTLFNNAAPASTNEEQLVVNISKCRMEIAMTVDNAFDLYVDGQYVGSGNDWQVVYRFNTHVQSSDRVVVAVKAIDWGVESGLVGIFGGAPTSPRDWKCQNFTRDSPPQGWTARSFNDSAWPRAIVHTSVPPVPLAADFLWTKGYTGNPMTVFCRGLIQHPALLCQVSD
eukprot:762575-Hanusia_phi.AAC.4